MKKLIFVLIIAFCASIGFAQNNIPKFTSVLEATTWVHSKISYLLDPENIYQTPEISFKLGTGDCEDIALAVSYVCRLSSIQVETIALELTYESGEKFLHLANKYKGVIYDATLDEGFILTSTNSLYPFVEVPNLGNYEKIMYFAKIDSKNL